MKTILQLQSRKIETLRFLFILIYIFIKVVLVKMK